MDVDDVGYAASHRIYTLKPQPIDLGEGLHPFLAVVAALILYLAALVGQHLDAEQEWQFVLRPVLDVLVGVEADFHSESIRQSRIVVKRQRADLATLLHCRSPFEKSLFLP